MGSEGSRRQTAGPTNRNRIEADARDKEANISKVQNLSGTRGRIYGGHKRESECALPGEICSAAVGLPLPRGKGKAGQKSAEAIVGPSTGLKGRT